MKATLQQSVEMQKALTKLAFFKGGKNATHRVVFPLDAAGDVFLNVDYKHKVQTGQKYPVSRNCLLHVPNPLSETGSNYASCPYCELDKMFREVANNKINAFKLANPNIDPKELKEFIRETFKANPASEVSIERSFLVAVISCNADGTPVIDPDTGFPKFVFNIMGMSDNRFNTKFLPNTKEWKHGVPYDFKFSFPDVADDKEAGKDMTIIAPRTSLFVNEAGAEAVDTPFAKYLTSKAEEIGFYDLPYFKPVSFDVAQAEASQNETRITGNMTDEERAQLRADLESQGMEIDPTVAAEIAATATASVAPPAQSFDVGAQTSADDVSL